MTIPFGKYKGLDTADHDVPTSYLAWMEQLDNITSELRKDLQQEIDRRSGDRPRAGKVTKGE